MTRKSLFFAMLMLPGVSFAANTLVYCNGCTDSQIKSVAEKVLSGANTLRVFDKRTQAITKWGIHQDVQSGPYRPPLEDDEPTRYAVKLRLNSNDLALKSAIIRARSRLNDVKNSGTNININVYHSQFNSAADAIRDKTGGAYLVYRELDRMGDWNALVSAVREAQEANNDSFSLSASLVQKMLGMTGQFNVGMDKVTFFITAHFIDGSIVKYAIDFNKQIDVQLDKSLIFVEAKDRQGQVIPEANGKLMVLISNEYSDNDVNINSLSRLFESFGGVDIEDYCSQQMKIKCYVTSSRSDGAGHVSYTFRCPRGTRDAC